MRIYFAGPQVSFRKELEGHYVLAAFDQPRQLKVLSAGWKCPGLLLDSGAFSAWKGGKAIDLTAYCDFIDDHKHLLDGYFALDVIGGTPAQNLANLDAMEARGLRPIPVFHEGDPWELLEEYLRRGYDYIGLGGTVSRGQEDLVDWLLAVFDRHPPGDRLRYHGLAMTQPRIITYLCDALYSVDSSSWLNPARFGVKGSAAMFKHCDAAFMRRLGIELINTMPRIGGEPTKNGQMSLL